MTTKKKYIAAVSLLAIVGVFDTLCAQVSPPAASTKPAGSGNPGSVLPASDPSNSGGWVLNEEVSDEFEGKEIDRSKWFVQGENGDYYIWKGRAPSQFAPHNVRVEDGMLKLTSRWDPDFDFAHGDYAGATYGDKIAPVTTAGVITRKRFLNGYMEVRSKAGNAAMTSSFWTIGYQSELDIYEQMGNPKQGTHTMENDFLFTVHDWRPRRFETQVGNNKTFTHKHKLDFRVADEFHVYACDWGEDYLKFYLDGKLVHSTTQKEVGDGWVLTNPMEIWLDSEIFRWMGYPDPKELPVDFQIDYVRVWQKPNANLLDRAFYGFEGPILFQDNPRPLDLTPEYQKKNNYQKFWEIDKSSSTHFSIVDEKSSRGIKSLRYDQHAEMTGNEVIVTGPKGSVKLPTGDFMLSMKVWVDPRSTLHSIRVTLESPKLDVTPISLSGIEKGKWVTVTRKFTRLEPSQTDDRMKIEVLRADTPTNQGAVYIDDIAIQSATRAN